jgi:N-acetylglutamate synthase-like GNAT family acetyltransferase
MLHSFTVRLADSDDAAPVEALLQVAYPRLMTCLVQAEVLKLALPLMTRANLALLQSGNFYAAESAGGQIIGCGGWTLARPGEPNGAVVPGLGHIRHFAVHPDWNRRGVGRAIFDRCASQAREAGIKQFECYSSLHAQSFYEAMGFISQGPMLLKLAPDVTFPAVRMTGQL